MTFCLFFMLLVAGWLTAGDMTTLIAITIFTATAIWNESFVLDYVLLSPNNGLYRLGNLVKPLQQQHLECCAHSPGLEWLHILDQHAWVRIPFPPPSHQLYVY
jgi:hypothetical protein